MPTFYTNLLFLLFYVILDAADIWIYFYFIHTFKQKDNLISDVIMSLILMEKWKGDF